MFTKAEKLILLTLAAVQFNHIVDFMIIMPLGPQLMRIFDITPAQFSLLVSIYTLMAGLSGFLASFYSDLFDRKKNLIVMFSLFAASTALCGFAENYEILFIFRACAGFFGGVMGSLVLSIVSDLINYERRGTAMGVMTSSFSLASIVGIPLSLYLAQLFGWHAPFIFLAALSLLVLALVFYVLPPMSSHIVDSNKTARSSLSWKPFLAILDNPVQKTALMFMFFLMLGHFTIIPFISPSLVANAGVPEASLPLIYLVGGACTFLTSPFVGRFSDKKGKSTVFITAAILSLIPIYLITHLEIVPLYLVLMTAGLFFMFAVARMIPAQALVSQAAMPEQRGSFLSIMSCLQSFGMALGAWVAGQIIVKNPESGRLEHYTTVGYVAIFFTILSVIIVQKIKHLDQRKTTI